MKKSLINIETKNCLNNIDSVGVFVIGLNRNADIFINMYKNDIKINGVISFDDKDVGKCFSGFIVKNKRCINNKMGKAIICDKVNVDTLDFLKNKKVKYGFYNSDFSYPGRQKLKFKKNSKKIYRVGYIAGVFDLFHIGHLNLIRKAKGLCDYLIVGVVTDKGAIEKNNKNLIIPFDERIEIVRSCKYVDEAVEIPYKYCSSYYAFKKYHFDVQFSGTDHEKDKYWIEVKKSLKSMGADIVYLPYTKQTSTTKIKERIKKGKF